MVKTLQKSGLQWEFIKQLTILECWHYYADAVNDQCYEIYLKSGSIPTDKNGKAIKYNGDIFSIQY